MLVSSCSLWTLSGMVVQRGSCYSPSARVLLTITPRYYDEIKFPMDFGTMGTKLTDHAYTTMEEFAQDVDLVFTNCRTFNPPTTYPVNCADSLERAFKKEWQKAMEKKLSWNEKRSLQGIMTKLNADPTYVYLGFQTKCGTQFRLFAQILRFSRTGGSDCFGNPYLLRSNSSSRCSRSPHHPSEVGC